MVRGRLQKAVMDEGNLVDEQAVKQKNAKLKKTNEVVNVKAMEVGDPKPKDVKLKDAKRWTQSRWMLM